MNVMFLSEKKVSSRQLSKQVNKPRTGNRSDAGTGGGGGSDLITVVHLMVENY